MSPSPPRSPPDRALHCTHQHCLCALPNLDFEVVHLDDAHLLVESLVATGHISASMVENGYGRYLNARLDKAGGRGGAENLNAGRAVLTRSDLA